MVESSRARSNKIHHDPWYRPALGEGEFPHVYPETRLPGDSQVTRGWISYPGLIGYPAMDNLPGHGK